MKIQQRHMYARITLFDRTWYLHQVVRLAEALSYVDRAKRAGVPPKHVARIAARFSPTVYFMRKEMAGVVRDMQKRAA